MPDSKGPGRDRHHGRVPNGNGVRAERLPNKTSESTKQVVLCIERVTTVDMDDGQSLPPYIDDGIIWCRVEQRSGQTLWRRIFLQSSPTTPGAASAGDRSHAPRK